MSDANFMAGTPPTQAPQQGSAIWAQGMMQETLNAKRIAAIVALAWDGPQWMAFNVVVGLGENPKRIVEMADALAFAAGAESCRIGRRPGGLVIEIPKPENERRNLGAERLDGLTPPAPLAVALGVGTGGKVVWLNMADERFCHVVLGGSTGSGKTMLTHWTLYRLFRQNHIQQLRAVLLDPKKGELSDFAQVPHLLHPITSNPVDCGRVLNWAVAELDRRLAGGISKPRILIVIEEIADLATTGGILPAVGRIAQVGRSAGMHLLVTTQQPGSKSLGDALVNFKARAIGQVTTGTLTYGATGRAQTGANELLGRGDFMLVAAGVVQRFQAPLMDRGLLGRLPKGTPGSLEEKLPAVAYLADLQRDRRGGRGRRELDGDVYAELDRRLAAGATPDELKVEFGIGWERARRLVNGWRGGLQPGLEFGGLESDDEG